MQCFFINNHKGNVMNLPTQLETMMSMDSEESLKEKILFEGLSHEINHLIKTDFEKLVNLLYRIDVSESRLKEMLQTNMDKDAGEVIARLLIERQMQKIRLRKEFASGNTGTDDEEKW